MLSDHSIKLKQEFRKRCCHYPIYWHKSGRFHKSVIICYSVGQYEILQRLLRY